MFDKMFYLIIIVNLVDISNGWLWHADQTSTWWIYTSKIPGVTTSRNTTWLEFNNFYFSKPVDEIVPAIYNITNCDCPRIYMPICASDGRSYTNICWMNCKNWSKVEAKVLPSLDWDMDANHGSVKEISEDQVTLFHKGHCVSLLDPYYESVWKDDPDYETTPSSE